MADIIVVNISIVTSTQSQYVIWIRDPSYMMQNVYMYTLLHFENVKWPALLLYFIHHLIKNMTTKKLHEYLTCLRHPGGPGASLYLIW